MLLFFICYIFFVNQPFPPIEQALHRYYDNIPFFDQFDEPQQQQMHLPEYDEIKMLLQTLFRSGGIGHANVDTWLQVTNAIFNVNVNHNDVDHQQQLHTIIKDVLRQEASPHQVSKANAKFLSSWMKSKLIFLLWCFKTMPVSNRFPLEISLKIFNYFINPLKFLIQGSICILSACSCRTGVDNMVWGYDLLIETFPNLQEILGEDDFLDFPCKDNPLISLKSGDQVFSMVEGLQEKSFFLKALTATCNVSFGQVIDLSAVVSPDILRRIVDYCKYHSIDRSGEAGADGAIPWDIEFSKDSFDVLFNLLRAADRLKIQALTDLTGQAAANIIRGKTSEELREILNVTIPEEQ